MTLSRLWRDMMGYFAHPDPRVALGNTVALIVIGNQPFYPFYVWYAAGGNVPAAFLTWLSAPFFAAVPYVAARAPDRGRALLLAAAIGNTVLATRALGAATAVELFYIPSLFVAWAAFDPGSRRAPLAGAGAATIAGWTIGRFTGQPLAALDADQNHALATMHAISVACLTAIIAYQAWRIARLHPISRSGS